MPAAKFACFTDCCDTAVFLTTKTRLIKSKYLSYLRDDTQGTFGVGEVKKTELQEDGGVFTIWTAASLRHS